MKVKDIKVGEIFTIDNTYLRPKLKIKDGFVDMATQYIYINRKNITSTICTESELNRIQRNWRMTTEKFDNYKKSLTSRFIKEVNIV